MERIVVLSMQSFGPEHALIVLGAVALDALVGEVPNRVHPVVGMGALTRGALRFRPSGRAAEFVFGLLLVLFVVSVSLSIAWALKLGIARASSSFDSEALEFASRSFAEAVLLSTLFAGRGLLVAARRMRQALQSSLPQARSALSHLCSRDPRELNRADLCGATVESLAENASDSFVAPLFWYVVVTLMGGHGLLGATAYRAINTLDAMIGYRGTYEYVGKPAARLDDACNWLPARLTAALLLLATALCRLDLRAAWTTAWRQHRATESPNAGWPMATAAGALRVELTKRDAYVLGKGFAPPEIATIRQCEQLLVMTFALGAGLIVALGVWPA